MANLSQQRREKMIEVLSQLRSEKQDDMQIVRALNEIEKALNEKKYGLVWEEHTEHVDEMINTQIPVLEELEDRKILVDESLDYNFLIEGDNLHSLKLLEKTHLGKVDIIYIDPPYNTGNKDFIYDDEYIDSEDSYRHSKWLSFMSCRLEIAKNLLCDKGVIFISIDDNEQGQLKLLCDEIFSESNFIAELIVSSNSSKNNSNYISVSHEYILCYAKNLSNLPVGWKVPKQQIKAYEQKANQLLSKGLSGEEIHKELLHLVKYPRFYDFDHYTYADANGVYRTDNPGGVANGNLDSEIVHPITGKFCRKPNGGWRYSDEKLRELLNDNMIAFGKDESIIPTIKRYLHDYKEQVPKSTMFFDSQSTTKWLKSKKISFDFPKAIELIKHILTYTQNKNAVILDFFAGSGTTGHAVSLLNKEDGGNRRYILCTNNENGIAENVTYKRLTVIQDELPHNLKYFKTEYVPKFDEDTYVSTTLLEYIKPLIELEHACDLESSRFDIILDEDEFDSFIEDGKVKENGILFIASDILMSSDQEQILKDKNCRVEMIPEYYYKEELIELGEI